MGHLVDRLRNLLQHNTHDQSSDGQRSQNDVAIKAHANGADSFSPPEGVRSAAKRGLELRSKFGRGGTSVGIARGRDLSNGKAVSSSTIRRMNSFFARHAVDKRPDWSNPAKPSNGYIAHLLWGGDAGRAWASKISRHLDATKKERVTTKSKNKPSNPALWAKAVAAAKRKYDVYPSAYANGYAARWYAKRGGTWTTKKQYRFKHGKHDQSSHGRRQGGGGGLAPATMGARPAKAVPTPGQLGMFDVFDAPTPTPAPTPAPVQPVRRQVPVNQQHINEHIKDINEQIKVLGKPKLSDAQQARVDAIVQHVAQHAEETHRLRQERLYDENGNFVATDQERRTFRAEMVERGKTVREKIMNEFADTETGIVEDMSLSEYEALGPGGGQLLKAKVDAIAGIALRETMRQVTPTSTLGLWTGISPKSKDKVLDAWTAVYDAAGPYVHMTPNENTNINLSEGRDARAYGSYQRASDSTGDSRIYLADETKSIMRTTAIHEYGHFVEDKKDPLMVHAEAHLKERVGESDYVQKVAVANKRAVAQNNNTFTAQISASPTNLMPYMNTAYFKTGYTYPATPIATEYLSVMFENVHSLGVSRTFLSTIEKGATVKRITKFNPTNFDYMYATTQY